MSRHADLHSRTVLVTGGADGIGAAIVRAFADQGSRVVFCDVDRDGGASLAIETGSRFALCDVTDTAALQTLVTAVSPDVLVNNAAWDDRHSFEDITPEYLSRSQAINFNHLVFAAQAAGAAMRARSSGAIVNIGSINARLGPSDLALYAAMKAGVEGLTRSLASAWGREGVRVNAVLPGWVETRRQRANWLTPEAEAAWKERAALGRILEPKEIASAVHFLASDAASAITGHCLVADGGVF
jgi:D-xylose 1-dehydrogenase